MKNTKEQDRLKRKILKLIDKHQLTKDAVKNIFDAMIEGIEEGAKLGKAYIPNPKNLSENSSLAKRLAKDEDSDDSAQQLKT